MTDPVSFKELNTLTGIDVTRTIQDQIDNIAVGDIVLSSGKILVGQVSGVAAAVTVSGAATISTAGAVSLAAASVTGALLTGLAAGTDSSILASDTILVALAKLQA